MIKSYLVIFATMSFLFVTFPIQVFSAGFDTSVNSASAVGSGFSGRVTGVNDISDMFVNPASLIKFQGSQFNLNLSYLDLSSSILPGAVATTSTIFGSQNIDLSNDGSTGLDFTESAAIPMLYGLYDVSDTFKLGLSVTVPWGLSTHYDDDWIGRYHAIDSEVKSLNISPVAAYRLNDYLSIAGGLQVQYFDTLLSTAIDFGSIIGLSPDSNLDGKSTITADDWSFGFKLGVLVTFNQSEVGIGYRSRIKHKLTGTNDFSLPLSISDLLTAEGAFVDTGITTLLTTPESVDLGFSQIITDKLIGSVDVSWTRWSRLENLIINHNNPVQPDDITVLKWKDSYYLGLGMNYKVRKQWTFRTGIGYETSATNGTNLNPRVPLDDKFIFSLGSDHKIGSQSSITWALMHQIFQNSSSSLNESDPNNQFRGNLNTGYEINLNVFSIGFNHRL